MQDLLINEVVFQGPLHDTFNDFWRMCWELRSATIVMMTKLEERTRIKCDQYWPTRGTDTYGNITVTVADVHELATYCVRTFHVNHVSVQDIVRGEGGSPGETYRANYDKFVFHCEF